jgi:molybdopterin-guanine dinucleotide biosynthesis protein B
LSLVPPSPQPPTPSPSRGRDPAVALSGPSGSGKTELICGLVGWFEARGLRVAVLKHSHKQICGDRGKDTWRYRQAGARLVALAAPGFLQVIRSFSAEPPLPQVLAALKPEADLILVEGYKNSPLPKLAVAASPPEEPLPDYPQVIAWVSRVPLVTNLPVFSPDQVPDIGRFILKFLGLADALDD